MDKLSSRVVERFLVVTADEDRNSKYLEFNTKLAKLLQRLKRDAGATVVSQNYRGTGSQAYRRQVFVRFKDNVLDLWLNDGMIKFGGILRDRRGNLPEGIKYESKTPEQVYAEVAKLMKEWAEGSEPT